MVCRRDKATEAENRRKLLGNIAELPGQANLKIPFLSLGGKGSLELPDHPSGRVQGQLPGKGSVGLYSMEGCGARATQGPAD